MIDTGRTFETFDAVKAYIKKEYPFIVCRQSSKTPDGQRLLTTFKCDRGGSYAGRKTEDFKTHRVGCPFQINVSYRRKTKLYAITKTILEHVHERVDLATGVIPPDVIEEEWDVLPDGHCGFRALAITVHEEEQKWETVKKEMHEELQRNRARYKDIGVDDNHVSRVLTNVNEIVDSRYWFSVPDCAQIAADTYKCPIVICSQVNNTLFIPIQNIIADRPPIILRLKDAHFSCVELKSDIRVKLPPLNPRHVGLIRRGLKNYKWNNVKKMIDGGLIDDPAIT